MARGVGERDNAELVAFGCEVFLRKLLRATEFLENFSSGSVAQCYNICHMWITCHCAWSDRSVVSQRAVVLETSMI